MSTRLKKNGEESLKPQITYECNECGTQAKATEVQVDHIEPVGGTPAYPDGDWMAWMAKLFCGPENLQVLCKNCHWRKTLGERRAVSKIRLKRAKATRRSKPRPRVVK